MKYNCIIEENQDCEIILAAKSLMPFFKDGAFRIPLGKRIETEHEAGRILSNAFGHKVNVTFYGGNALVFHHDGKGQKEAGYARSNFVSWKLMSKISEV